MRGEFDRARAATPDHRKAIVKLIEGLAYRHSTWQVFSDFVEMAALSLSNAVDLAQREKREVRYLEIVKRYTREEVGQFPRMLGALVEALEAEPVDVLGGVFHDLELHNKYTGQFFTPPDVCRMMAKVTIGDAGNLQARIQERGYLSASEPAVGSGAMVIALAEELRAAGINYQNALHVTAVDVDAKAVHMAYVQFSLLHIPAIVVHGNSLSLEERGHWYTPAHILGSWTWKLHRHATAESRAKTEESTPVPQPEEAPKPPPKGPQLSLF